MMIRRLGLAAAALTTVLAVAQVAEAQISVGYGRGGWGRWGGGRSSWYVDTPYGSYGRGGYSPWYGGYGYGRYGMWDGYGGYPYGRPYRGFSVNFGSPGYYASPGYFSSPGYYSSGPMIYSSGSPVISSGSGVYDSGRSFDAGMQLSGSEAVVHVTLPDANAEVWIEGQPTQQRGMNRVFISPPLESGKTYSYTLKATWNENGRQVTREKTIDFQPGAQQVVNFSAQEGDRVTTEPAIAPQERRAGYQASANIHAGEVVRVENDVLIMRGADGREHRHRLATDGTILIEGRNARLSELRPGMRINVTAQPGDQMTVTRIESTGTTRASDGRDQGLENRSPDRSQQPQQQDRPGAQPSDRPASPPPGDRAADRPNRDQPPSDQPKDEARGNRTPPPPQ